MRRRLDHFINGTQLGKVRERALWLANMNKCLSRQLPLELQACVTLVNIDTRNRAVLHVSSDAWATRVRMQQRMLRSILASCGTGKLNGVVVKTRPASVGYSGISQRPAARRTITPRNRDLLASAAESVSHAGLRRSLRRLARKQV